MCFKKWRKLLSAIAVVCLTILFISLFYKNNLFLFSLLIAIVIFAFANWHKKKDIFTFITGAVLGPIAEIVCIKNGAWIYSNSSFIGVPLWLPLAWGLAAIIIIRLPKIVEKLLKD